MNLGGVEWELSLTLPTKIRSSEPLCFFMQLQETITKWNKQNRKVNVHVAAGIRTFCAVQGYFEPEILVKSLLQNFYLPPNTASFVIFESHSDPGTIDQVMRVKQEV